MIQPELFSDSHQAFKHFGDVTNPSKFLNSKGVVHPRWRLVVCLAAWPTTIWLVHFCLVHRSLPLFIVYVIRSSYSIYVMTLPKDISLWLSCVNVGSIVWSFFIVPPYVWFRSRWIKKALESKAIPVRGWNWFGPEVQLLMLREFTTYLARKRFYNPEAVNQLIETCNIFTLSIGYQTFTLKALTRRQCPSR